MARTDLATKSKEVSLAGKHEAQQASRDAHALTRVVMLLIILVTALVSIAPPGIRRSDRVRPHGRVPFRAARGS